MCLHDVDVVLPCKEQMRNLNRNGLYDAMGDVPAGLGYQIDKRAQVQSLLACFAFIESFRTHKP